MKSSHVFIVLAMLASSFSVSAKAPADIAVFATEKSQGSMSIGDNSAYTRTFEVTLANLADKSIDLSKRCLKAYLHDKTELQLDTLDEKLMTNTLAAGTSIKGIAVFSSTNENIFSAAQVKISEHCQ
ncbi:hypothetical protein CIG19_14035 [Enterobacterales bacterium CwR94]|nr:hypothetical protein CIG19_14035 [Enterobacterales bacterium CwR94]